MLRLNYQAPVVTYQALRHRHLGAGTGWPGLYSTEARLEQDCIAGPRFGLGAGWLG